MLIPNTSLEFNKARRSLGAFGKQMLEVTVTFVMSIVPSVCVSFCLSDRLSTFKTRLPSDCLPGNCPLGLSIYDLSTKPKIL